MRKLSSPLIRDIDLDNIVVEDLKKMMTSHEDINKKVAHLQGEHKGIVAMVANTNQRKSSKEIATTVERKKGHKTKDC